MRRRAPHRRTVQTPPRRDKTSAPPLRRPASSGFAIGTSSTWKQGTAQPPPLRGTAWHQCYDSIQAAPPALARQVDFLASACSLPPGGAESSKRSDGSRTRMGPFVQPAGHLMMVPAKRLANQRASLLRELSPNS
jgi:hypothetical protein